MTDKSKYTKQELIMMDNDPFVNTDLFSPVVKDGIPPETSYYWESWYDEMTSYIESGYSVGGKRITGYHFFYLNFWKIRGLNQQTGRKEIIFPRFLDLDYKYFHIMDLAEEDKKNLCFVKTRQIGATEKHGCRGGIEFSFRRASQTVFVSGEKAKTDKIMGDTIRGLDLLHDTEYYKRRHPNRVTEYVRASFEDEIFNPDGSKQLVTKGYLSEIYAYTAKHNAQVVSSKSPSVIVFEEAGVFPGLIKTYRFVEPSLYAENKKTGIAIFVGTGGETGKGVEELEYIFYHPDEFDCLSFDLSLFEDDMDYGKQKSGLFIGADYFHIIDQWGNSLRKESKEDRLAERKSKEGKDDEYELITQRPLQAHEAFMVASGGYFGKKIATALNNHRVLMNKHRETADIVQLGNLVWVGRDGTEYDTVADVRKAGDTILGCEWKPNGEGPFRITEHPKTTTSFHEIFGEIQTPVEGVYKAGTDSYDQNSAKTSSSMGACFIYKTFIDHNQTSNCFVANLVERPEDSDIFYENSAKLCFYYSAMNLIEFSKILIFNWYEKNGFDFMLCERPTLVTAAWIQNSQASNRFGIDPSTKDKWLVLLKNYLTKEYNIQKLYDLNQVRAYINFKLDPDYNCDITIASSLCIVQAKEDTEHEHAKEEEVEKSTKPFFGYQRVGSKIIHAN